MVRLRLDHFLHPRRSLQSLRYRIVFSLSRWWAEHKIGLRRGRNDHCWCGGALRNFEWHRSYGVCVDCGCYVNRRPPLPTEIAKVYSFSHYWHDRQRMLGFPTIENRASQDSLDGRLERWLAVVETYCPTKGRVTEIGCAHGALLAELSRRGYTCIGVEVDAQSAEWTRDATGLDIRAGIFPGIALPQCDLFMAFDVIEHSNQPEQFLSEGMRLLAPGGIAIIQTPTDRHESAPPFSDRLTTLFDDVEHLYIFTCESMRKLAQVAGLKVIAEAHGVVGFDITILRKPV